MAKFRMVPEDADEAAHIRNLMQKDIAANLPELNKDLKKLRKRLEWSERWEQIAADLEAGSDDEPEPKTEPAKPPKPARNATAAPTSKPASTAAGIVTAAPEAK